MEIAYYWVEYQENIKSQGFNFDPRIRCAMDVVSDKYYKLKILAANEINIMQGNNISNVSVLLGINGSGKTTLMKRLISLSCFAEEEETTGEYSEITRTKNLGRRCLYVTRKCGEYFVITNIRKECINVDANGISIKETIYYSDDEDRLADDMEHSKGIFGITSIYMTNTSYVMVRDGIGTHNGIDHISFMPERLTAVSNIFFDFVYPENNVRKKLTAFDRYSRCLKTIKGPGQFQQLCDLYYCAAFCESDKASTIAILNKPECIVKAASFFAIYDDFAYENKIQTAGQEHERILDLQKLYNLEKAKDSVLYVLKSNLVAEYILAHKDYSIKTSGVTDLDNIYAEIEDAIGRDEADRYYSSYFKNAVHEMKELGLALKNANLRHNILPKSDMAYKTGCVFKRENANSYFHLIERSLEYNNHLALNPNNDEYGSFILRYLLVENLYLSSGERAFQNLMSWLYWISRVGDITSTKRIVPKKNILLCIDEIDALCHPEWQRDIIGNVIETIEDNFSGYNIQLVISTHSPLCLSNVPTENILYLIRDEERGICQDCSGHAQTFGRNIYDILNDAFYLNGKTVGNYAVKYINELIRQINDDTPEKLYALKESFLHKIDYIGDLLIKEKLYQMLEDKMASKDSKKIRIQRLRRQQEQINARIASLEEDDV